MSISLYDASVGSYLQILPAVSALMNKASEHFSAQGVDLEEIVDARLHADMLPLRFQIVSVVHHSTGTIKGLGFGEFSPPAYDPKMNFTGLQAMLDHAQKELVALKADEINEMAGNQIDFVMGDLRLPFTAENFVLSFSLPNFHFHASTAYDILRHKGLPLGKRDYLGKLKIIRQ